MGREGAGEAVSLTRPVALFQPRPPPQSQQQQPGPQESTTPPFSPPLQCTPAVASQPQPTSPLPPQQHKCKQETPDHPSSSTPSPPPPGDAPSPLSTRTGEAEALAAAEDAINSHRQSLSDANDLSAQLRSAVVLESIRKLKALAHRQHLSPYELFGQAGLQGRLTPLVVVEALKKHGLATAEQIDILKESWLPSPGGGRPKHPFVFTIADFQGSSTPNSTNTHHRSSSTATGSPTSGAGGGGRAKKKPPPRNGPSSAAVASANVSTAATAASSAATNTHAAAAATEQPAPAPPSPPPASGEATGRSLGTGTPRQSPTGRRSMAL